MKITEIVLGVLVVTSLLFKSAHIPGGAVFSILSITALSLFYFGASYFIFKPDDKIILINNIAVKKTSVLKVLGSVFTGMALSTTLIGILFRLMHWSGAAAMLIVGLTSLIIIGAATLFKFLKTSEKYYKDIGIRILIFTAAASIAFIRYI